FILACAILRELSLRRVAIVVAASVLIDLDHIPELLGSGVLQGHGPRPYTHSVAGLLVVVLIALGLRGSMRVVMLIGAGITLHFWRDLAEPGGPGLALAWPASDAVATIPYALYAVTVGLLV